MPSRSAPSTPQVAGQIPDEVLSALRAGTPIFAIVPDDSLADGVAKQLASLGAFAYSGQVGDLRAPWIGNWLFFRDHATFSFLPVNRVLGVHYQAHGKSSNGLLIERAAGGEDPEVVSGLQPRSPTGKSVWRALHASSGSTPLLVHRAPEFSAPLQQK